MLTLTIFSSFLSATKLKVCARATEAKISHKQVGVPPQHKNICNYKSIIVYSLSPVAQKRNNENCFVPKFSRENKNQLFHGNFSWRRKIVYSVDSHATKNHIGRTNEILLEFKQMRLPHLWPKKTRVSRKNQNSRILHSATSVWFQVNKSVKNRNSIVEMLAEEKFRWMHVQNFSRGFRFFLVVFAKLKLKNKNE